MAVFRVEKTSNYTIMANYHLKSRDLSLKAKGLLSVILSLPEEWDYTLKGLSIISREGVDSIRKAVKELETAGYIVRSRRRNELGQLGAADYVIYEFPQTVLQPEPKKPTPPSHPESKQAHVHQEQPIPEKPVEDVPALDSPAFEPPMLEKPIQEKPTQENPMLEMSTQLNTNRSRTYSSTYPTDQKTQQIINPSIKNPSTNPVNAGRLRSKVELQLEYDILCAVNDFREAGRLIRRYRRRMNAKKKPDDAELHQLHNGVEKCESVQEDVAQFLLSVHFMGLCDLDGSILLDRLESEVA